MGSRGFSQPSRLLGKVNIEVTLANMFEFWNFGYIVYYVTPITSVHCVHAMLPRTLAIYMIVPPEK